MIRIKTLSAIASINFTGGTGDVIITILNGSKIVLSRR